MWEGNQIHGMHELPLRPMFPMTSEVWRLSFEFNSNSSWFQKSFLPSLFVFGWVKWCLSICTVMRVLFCFSYEFINNLQCVAVTVYIMFEYLSYDTNEYVFIGLWMNSGTIAHKIDLLRFIPNQNYILMDSL